MIIRTIPHQRIDRKLYDRRLHESLNGTLYAQSWYLDIVAPAWQLLATPDYAYMMPVPRKHKYGLPVVLQPMACQQLGVFASQPIACGVVDRFLSLISSVYTVFQLNAGNCSEAKGITWRDNYILDMNRPYETIADAYSSNTRRFLKKGRQAGLTVRYDLPTADYLALVKMHTGTYTDAYIDKMHCLLGEAPPPHVDSDYAIYAVVDEGETLAAAVFYRYKSRYCLLMPVSTELGRQKNAMRYLIDDFIHKHSQKPGILDFEGSSVASVAGFYKSFGAECQPYPLYTRKLFGLLNK